MKDVLVMMNYINVSFHIKWRIYTSFNLISLCYSCDMSLLIRFKCIRFYWNHDYKCQRLWLTLTRSRPLSGYRFAEVINVISGNERRKQHLQSECVGMGGGCDAKY